MDKKFKIYEEDYMGEKFMEIEGINEQDAAENYAREHRNDEGQLYDNSINVEVENEKRERKKYKVTCESMPYYMAEEVD